MGTCPEWIVRRHLSLHRGAGVYPANRHPYQCRSVFSPTKTNPTPPCRPKGTTYKTKPNPANVGRGFRPTNPTPPCRPKGTTYKTKPTPANVSCGFSPTTNHPHKISIPPY